MVKVKPIPVLLFLAAMLLLYARPVSSQAIPTNGRFSLFYNWSERDLREGDTADFSELIATLSLYSEPKAGNQFEFGLDTRVATFPGNEEVIS